MLSGLLEGGLFVVVDIALLTLGKTVDEEGTVLLPIENDRAIPPPDFPCPGRATRCLITPPPKSASISPCSARWIASRSTPSSSFCFLAKRSNQAFLKSFTGNLPITPKCNTKCGTMPANSATQRVFRVEKIDSR